MIAELGQFALALALAAAFAQLALSIFAAARHSCRQAAQQAAYAQGLLVFFAFFLLIMLFLRSDFSVALVALHSHSTKPVLYKIAASWGNHEGSLLLWVFFLGICSAALASMRRLDPVLKFYALAVQGGVSVLFLLLLILASNPFARIDPAPFQGSGLNPILQDPALAFHPPILYAGYVGSSLAFSLAVAALLAGRAGKDWAAALRGVTQFVWISLTLGIALGAWWAYRELGWGGFWFWDAVENAALMPWLAATALIHTIIMTQKRSHAASWAVLLSLLVFSLSVLGTFLTRSGIIVSVHSFASDPARGLFILLILTILAGGGFALFAARVQKLIEKPAPINLNSRNAAIMANSLFLIAALIAVLTGTLYPIIFEALTGQTIAAGPPYFQATFIPIMLPLLLLVPVAPFFAWAGTRHQEAIKPLIVPALAALATGLLVALVVWPHHIAIALACALAAWIIGGALTRLWTRRRFLPAEIPMICAHAGLGVLLAGIIGVSMQQETTLPLVKGQAVSFSGYQISFDGVEPYLGPDYRAERATLLIRDQGRVLARLEPEIRYYIARATPTREAAIHSFLFPLADFHAVLGDALENNQRAVKFYYNPLAPLLWIGALMSALGGLLSIMLRIARREGRK